MTEKEMYQSRFSEAIRDAKGVAKQHNKNCCICYSATTDKLFLSDENCVHPSAIQGVATPVGNFYESRNVHPRFCEV